MEGVFVILAFLVQSGVIASFGALLLLIRHRERRLPTLDLRPSRRVSRGGAR